MVILLNLSVQERLPNSIMLAVAIWTSGEELYLYLIERVLGLISNVCSGWRVRKYRHACRLSAMGSAFILSQKR